MAITVRQALTISGLSKCRVIAGINGLDKPISYVGSMEIPEIKPWLVKNQLLITTGYALRQTPESIISLVEDLHNADCSALAIKNRFTGPIPKRALELSDQLGVPLIEIPAELNFMDIVVPLTKALTAEHNRYLEFSQYIHSKFMELEISGGSLVNIAQMLSTLLKSTVKITDSHFTPIKDSINDAKWTDNDFQDFITKNLCNLDKFFSTSDTTYSFNYTNENNTSVHYIIVRKILLRNKVKGYIFITSDKSPDDISSIIIDHAATVSALEFSKLEALLEQRKLMENNLLIDIIVGNIKNDEATYRAINLKWPAPPLSLVIFDINKFENIFENKTENEIQTIKENINSIISENLYSNLERSIIISKSDSFICLIPGIKNKNEIGCIISKILLKINKNLNVSMVAGACQYIESYSELKNHYYDVRDAIVIVRAKKLKNGYIFISDARLEQTILHLSKENFLNSFISETVDKLKSYDKENDTDLLHTLSTLIKNMGIKTNTADELFIHRNTLAYRLKCIEKIIGCELSNTENIFSLGIALKAQLYIDYNKRLTPLIH